MSNPTGVVRGRAGHSLKVCDVASSFAGAELCCMTIVKQVTNPRAIARYSSHLVDPEHDTVIARVTQGYSYRHVIGFEAGETSRAAKDALHNTPLRTGEYPLIEWGWDRAVAIAYTQSIIGASPGKSACTVCPYSLQNRVSRSAVLNRYAAEPAVGAHALLMEHLALAPNPAQGLVGGRRLVDLVREHGELGASCGPARPTRRSWATPHARSVSAAVDRVVRWTAFCAGSQTRASAKD